MRSTDKFSTKAYYDHTAGISMFIVIVLFEHTIPDDIDLHFSLLWLIIILYNVHFSSEVIDECQTFHRNMCARWKSANYIILGISHYFLKWLFLV